MKTDLQKRLAIVAPSIDIQTFWSPDDDDPTDDSLKYWQTEIRASAVVCGEFTYGQAFMGGTGEKKGDNPRISNPTISGYEPQMTLDAVEELLGKLGKKGKSLASDHAKRAVGWLREEMKRLYDEQMKDRPVEPAKEPVSATPSTVIERKKVQHKGGAYYDSETPLAIINALESSYDNGKPVRLFLGDSTTGECWNDEHDVYGWVSRSTGPIKIPILKRMPKSSGGGAILDHCIVRLMLDGIEVYRHPGYKLPVIVVREAKLYDDLPWTAYLDGEEHANFETQAKAERWRMFMLGESMKK